jgi:hypothetical protein
LRTPSGCWARSLVETSSSVQSDRLLQPSNRRPLGLATAPVVPCKRPEQSPRDHEPTLPGIRPPDLSELRTMTRREALHRCRKAAATLGREPSGRGRFQCPTSPVDVCAAAIRILASSGVSAGRCPDPFSRAAPTALSGRPRASARPAAAATLAPPGLARLAERHRADRNSTIGSAHRHPATASRPTSNAADRYAHSMICRLSLTVAEEPSARTTCRFAAASGGIPASVTAARPTPSQLASGSWPAIASRADSMNT